jgi:LuxR family transcriptional regulator, maltose regulon positive regulatory protein
VIGLAQTGLVEIGLERGDRQLRDDWIQDLAKNYERIEASDLNWDNMVRLSLRMVKYFLAAQDLGSARIYFEKAVSRLEQSRQPYPYLPIEVIDMQVRIWAATGELSAAERRFEDEILALNPIRPKNPAAQTALARVYLAQGHPELALTILTGLETELLSTGQVDRLIETRILAALAYQAHADESRALQCLGQALQLAEGEGYMRYFVECGEPLRTLLELYAGQAQPAVSERYLQRLREAFALRPAGQTIPAPQQPALTTLIPPLVEPLSKRETEVLGMLAAGMSAKEMASAMTISVNTVKTHVKNIYRKLGGHTRNVVFQKASELGILKHGTEN